MNFSDNKSIIQKINTYLSSILIEPKRKSDLITSKNSKLLSTILLIFISFGFLSVIPHIMFSDTIFSDPYIITALVTSTLLIIPYLLSRYLYVSLSAILTSVSLSIVLFFYAIFLDPGDYLTLDYLVLPLLMIVFFQERKLILVIVLLLNMIVLLLLPILSASYTFSGIINFSLLFNVLIVSIVYTLHSFILKSEKEYQEKIRKTDSRIYEMEKTDVLLKFSQGIAHDFNNILTVIDNSIDLLNMDTLNEFNYDIIEGMKKASNESKELIKQLLNFTKTKDLEITEVDLNNSINSIYYVIKQLAQKSRKIELDLYEKNLFIRINPVELKQIILNLVINAIEAVSDTGIIKITTHKSINTSDEISYACLNIEDNGIGIPNEMQNRIFEPFVTTKDRGTGIGLATVKEIVNKYSGQYSIDSEVGVGTKFTVCFPLQKGN